MNEIAKIAARVGAPVIRPVEPVAPQPKHEIDATPRRVDAGGFKDTPEQTASLIRLDRTLASEQQPRTDVPRGYYLDIVV